MFYAERPDTFWTDFIVMDIFFVCGKTFTKPLPATKKNVLPIITYNDYNNVIYQFLCHCDSRYIGHTSQRLQKHIKQHILRSIRNHHSSQDHFNLSCACKTNSTSQIIANDSAIEQHLLENHFCANQYSDTKFSILALVWY